MDAEVRGRLVDEVKQYIQVKYSSQLPPRAARTIEVEGIIINGFLDESHSTEFFDHLDQFVRDYMGHHLVSEDGVRDQALSIGWGFLSAYPHDKQIYFKDDQTREAVFGSGGEQREQKKDKGMEDARAPEQAKS